MGVLLVPTSLISPDSFWVFIFRVIPAAFWLLLFLLKCPAAVAAAQGESGSSWKWAGEAARQRQGCGQEKPGSLAVLGWGSS